MESYLVVVSQTQMGASWGIGIDDRSTELVTRGLFGLVRNPIFSGLLLALLGFVLIEKPDGCQHTASREEVGP